MGVKTSYPESTKSMPVGEVASCRSSIVKSVASDYFAQSVLRDDEVMSFSSSLALREAASSAVRPAWEAILWKRSRHLRVWRRRHVRLYDAGGHWQLSSYDHRGRITGRWELERCMPYIELAPRSRFAAAMELAGVVLASDSAEGAEVMEELAVILNGRLMRRSSHSACSRAPSFRDSPAPKRHCKGISREPFVLP